MTDVSIDEIVEYYISQDIYDYPKTLSGKPKMSCVMNKKTKMKLMKEKLLKKNKKENMHSYRKDKGEYYRNEIINMSDEDIDELKNIREVCAICQEKISNDYCKLKCDHMFCFNCIINHCQTKTNCPLCREEICKIINKPNNVDNESHIPRFITSEAQESIIKYLFNDDIQYYSCNDEEHDNIPKTFETMIDEEMDDIKKVMMFYKEDTFSLNVCNLYINNLGDNLKKNIGLLMASCIEETTISLN